MLNKGTRERQQTLAVQREAEVCGRWAINKKIRLGKLMGNRLPSNENALRVPTAAGQFPQSGCYPCFLAKSVPVLQKAAEW